MKKNKILFGERLPILLAAFIITAFLVVVVKSFSESPKKLTTSLNTAVIKNNKPISTFYSIPLEKLSTLSTPKLQNKKTPQRQAADPLVIIYFNGAPTTFTINKAPLKYNKNFAYSFTLDDGKEDAYTAAYPLFSGGPSTETGASYPGLSYTDGCGNAIPFKAGIAINSTSSNGTDPHQGTPGSISWDQLKELHSNRWDVFNHSYSHQYGPGTDYNAQIINNNTYVKDKTGITMTHFVIPSGDSEYAPYAFANGMKAVYNQNDAPGAEGLQVDPPLNLTDFKLIRQYLNDDNYSEFSSTIDVVAAKSNTFNHFWYNEFTHHVSNTAKGGSLLFSSFKSHMEKLETSYGSKGSDVVWMAPLQEVYEYLKVRETASISSTQESDQVNLYTNFSQVPDDLRRYAMTFVVTSDKNITDVACASASHISFSGTGTTKIINIEWANHPDEITTGLNDVESWLSGNITIYPNPVENTIALNFPGNAFKKVSISLINEQGIEYLLGESEVVNERATVDIKKLNLKKGPYIVRISSSDGKFQFSKVVLKE